MEIWQTKEVNIRCERQNVAEAMATIMTRRHRLYVTAIREDGGWIVTNRFDPTIIEITKPLTGEIK